MVKIADIKDRDSLKAWLEAQPKDLIRPYAVAIASRAALRVVPQMWHWTHRSDFAKKRDMTALPFMRCNVIAAVACNVPTAAIRKAAAISAEAADATLSHAENIAAEAAADAADTVTYATSAHFAAAYAAAADGGVDLWPEIQADCSILTANNTPKNWPLWQGNSDPFADIWAEVKQNIPAEVTFWADWYEAMLVGRAQNWDMLEEIALLPDDDWKAGAQRIAELVAEIEARYEAQDLPAETTPQNALMKNAIAIEAQLNALEIFVQDEIERICKNLPNDISDEARKQIDRRIDVLKGIIDAIREMIKSLADETIQTGTALATFNKNLPAVIDAADSIAQQQPEVSETIVAMGATVSHLTKSGMPGTTASRVAVAELVFKSIKNWLNRKK